MYYIGIDLGTSAIKLLLMEGNGKICNIVSKEYPLSFPNPGWSEQNPYDWYDQMIAGIKELVNGFDTTKVAGISFGGQMHGLVILDENDNVIRPAILWNDGRTTEETDYLNNVIGKDKLSQYTANISFTGFTAPKILWVKNKEPENFAKIEKIMLPKDYIAYKLSGVHCTDVSDASGMLLFDVKNRCWSKEMCEICGVKEEQLAKIYESYETVGTVLPEIAKELGIPESCKVVAGAGDNAAAAVGTGTVGDGMCNISLGTSGTIFISSEKFGVDKNNALHAFAHADGTYHLMGCMLSAASCNKWWMEEILQTKEFAKEQDLVFLCGHYEGIDERVLEEIVTDYVSIGDYVLTGGELPAMVLVDCVSRYVDGVISTSSLVDESFSDNLLEYPQYTRPQEYKGLCVPEVLLGGDHAKVDQWRREQALLLTKKQRPDLLGK